MTILDNIIAYKRQEVKKRKEITSINELEATEAFGRTPISLKKSLRSENSTGIIAEFKRKSPSKNIINDRSTVADVTQGYLDANVAAQSILTDTHFFSGTNEDLIKARAINVTKPILRKDFIVDEFQLIEAKALGADVILLIATCLTSDELTQFSELANSLEMEVLFEIHTQEDLDRIKVVDDKIIGVNNRNLKTFKVDLEHSIQLANQLPASAIRVSESGISDPKVIADLRTHGFEGFLIGETFMKAENPGLACKTFINQIKQR